MKYVWIVMLAIADLIWIIASIADVAHTIKNRDWRVHYSIDPVAKACAGTHLAILFIVSFLMWLFD